MKNCARTTACWRGRLRDANRAWPIGKPDARGSWMTQAAAHKHSHKGPPERPRKARDPLCGGHTPTHTDKQTDTLISRVDQVSRPRINIDIDSRGVRGPALAITRVNTRSSAARRRTPPLATPPRRLGSPSARPRASMPTGPKCGAGGVEKARTGSSSRVALPPERPQR